MWRGSTHLDPSSARKLRLYGVRDKIALRWLRDSRRGRDSERVRSQSTRNHRHTPPINHVFINCPSLDYPSPTIAAGMAAAEQELQDVRSHELVANRAAQATQKAQDSLASAQTRAKKALGFLDLCIRSRALPSSFRLGLTFLLGVVRMLRRNRNTMSLRLLRVCPRIVDASPTFSIQFPLVSDVFRLILLAKDGWFLTSPPFCQAIDTLRPIILFIGPSVFGTSTSSAYQSLRLHLSRRSSCPILVHAAFTRVYFLFTVGGSLRSFCGDSQIRFFRPILAHQLNAPVTGGVSFGHRHEVLLLGAYFPVTYAILAGDEQAPEPIRLNLLSSSESANLKIHHDVVVKRVSSGPLLN
ncbi:hypothetical protein NMY22_g9612 [Coprinellus aureogranulatus]|nr:hypothetical protein NMY22_g9612 [Coprinellus aureogranulatus]